MLNNVYVGIWRDYDSGSVLATRWTVTDRIGTLLLTLLAILVAVTANCSWKILRF
ncbi:hypothetical protein CC86DRAFT_367551 [Ophiobolus disseminans]|uniref:Uncharacterized protein n=1 Tax=Ophiobolus disseminans TaxID=1469910 RepID=A0A6A7AE39_9PLEO|nr:hypothetical protein CC86DRAFT_367551 [Ophiobolus disseminans]